MLYYLIYANNSVRRFANMHENINECTNQKYTSYCYIKYILLCSPPLFCIENQPPTYELHNHSYSNDMYSRINQPCRNRNLGSTKNPLNQRKLKVIERKMDIHTDGSRPRAVGHRQLSKKRIP